MKSKHIFTQATLSVLALGGLLACSGQSSSKSPVTSRSMTELKGTDTGGGGSPRDIQKRLVERVRSYLYSEIVRITTSKDIPIPELKGAAMFMVMNRAYYPQLKEESLQILEKMFANGYWEDFRDTEIVIKDKCIDMYGKERAATSPMNQMRGTICLNPNAVIDDLGYTIPDSALIALILHEYAHHFGYEDKDYSFAVDIANAIETRNAESSLDVNPNTLIRPQY